jgi:ABC-type glycerol-3-phosphate transport system substrate-binding protein
MKKLRFPCVALLAAVLAAAACGAGRPAAPADLILTNGRI